jgi:hypothetical protein
VDKQRMQEAVREVGPDAAAAERHRESQASGSPATTCRCELSQHLAPMAALCSVL